MKNELNEFVNKLLDDIHNTNPELSLKRQTEYNLKFANSDLGAVGSSFSADGKIAIGDKVRIDKGTKPTLTVQHIIGKVVWFEETNDNCLLDECRKVE